MSRSIGSLMSSAISSTSSRRRAIALPTKPVPAPTSSQSGQDPNTPALLPEARANASATTSGVR
jgi:hypothetical protein